MKEGSYYTFFLDVAEEEIGEQNRAVLLHTKAIVFNDLAWENDFFYKKCQISIPDEIGIDMRSNHSHQSISLDYDEGQYILFEEYTTESDLPPLLLSSEAKISPSPHIPAWSVNSDFSMLSKIFFNIIYKIYIKLDVHLCS